MQLFVFAGTMLVLKNRVKWVNQFAIFSGGFAIFVYQCLQKCFVLLAWRYLFPSGDSDYLIQIKCGRCCQISQNLFLRKDLYCLNLFLGKCLYYLSVLELGQMYARMGFVKQRPGLLHLKEKIGSRQKECRLWRWYERLVDTTCLFYYKTRINY